jgi:integration host factor subunit alpha
VIANKLCSSEEVKLSGFGNFTLLDKKARPGRNPRTLANVLISARRVITFKSTNKLKSIISAIEPKKESDDDNS